MQLDLQLAEAAGEGHPLGVVEMQAGEDQQAAVDPGGIEGGHGGLVELGQGQAGDQSCWNLPVPQQRRQEPALGSGVPAAAFQALGRGGGGTRDLGLIGDLGRNELEQRLGLIGRPLPVAGQTARQGGNVGMVAFHRGFTVQVLAATGRRMELFRQL